MTMCWSAKTARFDLKGVRLIPPAEQFLPENRGSAQVILCK
jgi:hypothetical protein